MNRETKIGFLAGLLINSYQSQPGPSLIRMMSIANYFQEQGNINAALLWYRLALNNTISNSDYKLVIYEKLLHLLAINGDYERAMQLYYHALTYTNNDSIRSRMFLHISEISTTLEDYEKGLRYLDIALMHFEKANDPYLSAIAHIKKGIIYRSTKSYKQVIAENKKAYYLISKIKINKENPNRRERSILEIKNRISHDIGSAYIQLNMADSGFAYFRQINLEQLPKEVRAVVMMSIGSTFIAHNKIKIGNSYFEEGLDIVRKSNSLDLKVNIYNDLSNDYANRGNYKKAWEYQKEYMTLKDSLASLETIHRINALELQYEKSQNDQKLARKELLIVQQASKLKEQYWLAGSLFLIILFLCILFIISRKNYRNKRKLLNERLNSAEQERRIAQIEAGVKGEEKERIRIAKELHDGVMSEMLALKLNLKAMKDGYPSLQHAAPFRNALQQSEDIALKLRQTAHNLMPLRIQEQGLFASIKAFLRRVNTNDIRFSFQHYGHLPSLKPEVEKIIFLMVLELIQNIIKHSKASEAIIQLNYFDETLSITIEDNGVGFATGPNVKNTGMGLINIQENIAVLHASFDIKSSEYSGTTILIEIPLILFLEKQTL